MTAEKPSGRLLAGRYRLVREIARGGMASVWEAIDTSLDRRVAVKLLHPQLADEPEFIERFRREARAAASLGNPNVVPVFDSGEDAETRTPFIVMELVDGPTLKDRIRADAPLPDAEIRAIGAALASALDFAHRRGIVHRDVKPQNVLMGEDGRPRLTDFGIAQALSASQLTRTGAVMGSVHYVAPEVVRGKPASPSADIYGLGAVLYEMATGRVPFSGETDIAVALAHVEETPPAPRTHNVHLSPDLEHIILRSLAKAPEERFASAGQLADALRNGLGAVPPSMAETARIPTPGSPASAVDAAVAAANALPRPDDGSRRAAPAAGSAELARRSSNAAAAAARGRSAAAVPAQAQTQRRVAQAAVAQPAPGRRVVRPRARGASGSVLGLMLAMATVLVALGVGFFGLASLSREGLAPPGPTARPTAQPTAPPKPAAVPTSAAASKPTTEPTSEPTPEPSPTPAPPSPTPLPPTATAVPATPTPRTIPVPQLRGKTLEDARAALQADGLTMTVRGANVNADKNVVFDQSPDVGTSLSPNGSVQVTVGSGNTPIPDVAGRPREQATRLLSDNSFRVTVRQRSDPRVPAGAAIETKPAAGAVTPRGADVELWISQGR